MTNYDCTIEDHDPGQPGSGGGGSCIGQGPFGPVEVACYDPMLGAYVGNNCYLRQGHPGTDVFVPGAPPSDAETPGAWNVRTCLGTDGSLGAQIYEWIANADAPALTPEQLARRALASIELLPADLQIVPDPEGSGLVGMPVWMWTPVNTNTWGPISASDSNAGLTVSITARAVSIAWSMGDGTTVTCDNPGTPYEPRFGNRDSPTCGHEYEKPGVFTVTATTTWRVSWSGGGQSGVIIVFRQSETEVRIEELQVVVE